LDARSSPLSRVMELLPSVDFQYIFVENVAGFEKSDAHEQLIDTLVNKCNFNVREFLLSPTDLGIPNSRLRYYLLGRLNPFHSSLSESGTISTSIPTTVEPVQRILDEHRRWWESMRRNSEISPDFPHCIGDILERDVDTEAFCLPPTTMKKYWNAVDVVDPSSTHSCCFTKAYHHYMTGTGSLLDCTTDIQLDELTSIGFGNLNKLPLERRKVRYFTPTEVARLLCYPTEFSFPDQMSLKAKYKALGNSVNVCVVSALLSLLFYK